MTDREALTTAMGAFRAIVENDKTRYEHHDPRPDGKRPRDVGTGSIFRTPREIARRALEDCEERLAASPSEPRETVEQSFLLDAVAQALDGREVSDFALSFPLVSDAADLASRCSSAECMRDDRFAAVHALEAEIARLRASPSEEGEREAHDLIKRALDFAHGQYAIRREINAGEEGHTYENGWCDALAGLLDAMGLDIRALSVPTSQPCGECGGSGAGMCLACHDGGIDGSGEDCHTCQAGKRPPKCRGCGGIGRAPPASPEVKP